MISGLDMAYTDLLDPAKTPDPRDALRAADAVREAREAAEGLGLDAEDAAGAAVLWLAARMDTGSRTLNGAGERLAHSVAIALLLRTPRSHELLNEAGWLSNLTLRLYGGFAWAYSRFRTWLDSVAAEFRLGELRGPRVGLALAAAKALGATDTGQSDVAHLVAAHGRKMAVEPGDVPGALVLAREQGAQVEGLLRRAPHGLRWVERKARDLVEKVTPRRDPVDGAMATEANRTDNAPGPLRVAEAAELLDQIAALGDAIDRVIVEGWEETDDTLGQQLDMSGRAVRKRRRRIRERVDRLLG